MKKTVFVITKEELRKYAVNAQSIFFVKAYALEEGLSEKELFEGSSEAEDFDIYFARDIIFEAEHELFLPLSEDLIERSIQSALLENPLYDPEKHIFVFLSLSGSLKGQKRSVLANIFYFEKKWIRLIEKLFLEQGFVPRKAGILSAVFCNDPVSGSFHAGLSITWIHDIEINLVHDAKLLYSRHIPFMAGDVAEGAREIICALQKLKARFPDANKARIFFLSEEAEKHVRTLAEKNDLALSFHSLNSEKHFPLSVDECREDRYLVPVFSSICSGRALIDLSRRVRLSLTEGNRSFRWLRFSAAAFCLLGLLGLLMMKGVQAKVRRGLHDRLQSCLSQDIQSIDLQEAFVLAEQRIQQSEKFLNTPSAMVLNQLIYCIPRDTQWELEFMKKNSDSFSLVMVFSSEEPAKAFLRAVGKINTWKLLSGQADAGGRVSIVFHVREKNR